MILFWILVGAVAVVVWMVWGSRDLCPDCGLELGEVFGYPGRRATRCRHCGWDQHGRGY